MIIVPYVKFLFLIIIFISVNSFVKSEIPSFCSELYGCQTGDPKDNIVQISNFSEFTKNSKKKYLEAIKFKDSNNLNDLEKAQELIKFCNNDYGEKLAKVREAFPDFTKCQIFFQSNLNKINFLRAAKIEKERGDQVHTKFELTCSELGFVRDTEKFSNCVLKLRDKFKKPQIGQQRKQAQDRKLQAIRQKQREHQKELQVQQQKQEEQQRQLQAQRQKEELEYIRQQQALLKKQQEAQESENLFKSLMMIGQGLDMMNGTGAYAPNVNTGYQSKGLGLIDSYQSGMNKVCVYDTITGREIKTLKNSLSICPLTP